eukprot:10900-Eustigmatos_ZCMA.PRE.1
MADDTLDAQAENDNEVSISSSVDLLAKKEVERVLPNRRGVHTRNIFTHRGGLVQNNDRGNTYEGVGGASSEHTHTDVSGAAERVCVCPRTP